MTVRGLIVSFIKSINATLSIAGMINSKNVIDSDLDGGKSIIERDH